MAQQHKPEDPFEHAIADGRCHFSPTNYFGLPDILDVNLQQLYDTMELTLQWIFQADNRFRAYYPGTYAQVTALINADIATMLTYAIFHTYNRLRDILGEKHPAARAARMHPKCPHAPRHHVFPTWLSSTLSSIGPCRVRDAGRDKVIVWATPAANMNNFGLDNPPAFNAWEYQRFLDACRFANIPLAPFDDTGRTGSFFPTIDVQVDDGVYMLYGTVHDSHYENEDIVRALFCINAPRDGPFEKVGMTIGYIDNEAAINAVAAAPAPANTPAGVNVDSPGRLAGLLFKTNYFGIQPAVPAAGRVPGRPRGIYLAGRGDQRYYQCIVANDISVSEVLEYIRYRLIYGKSSSRQPDA